MPSKINQIFRAIADPTRREIFNLLIIGGTALSITQISDQFDMTRQGIRKHVKLLSEAGLVEISSSGRETLCLADARPLKEISDWVGFYEKFWDDALGRLEKYMDKE